MITFDEYYSLREGIMKNKIIERLFKLVESSLNESTIVAIDSLRKNALIQEVSNSFDDWIDKVASINELYEGVDISNMDNKTFLAWLMKFDNRCHGVLSSQIEIYSREYAYDYEDFDRYKALEFSVLVSVCEKYNNFRKAIALILNLVSEEKLQKFVSNKNKLDILLACKYLLPKPIMNITISKSNPLSEDLVEM